MSGEAPSWERIRETFNAALEVAPAERGEWLHRHCGDDAALLTQVERLLVAHDASASLLDGNAGIFVAGLVDDGSAADTRIGTHFGAYRLLQLLGAGGMGSVYLAERTDGQFEHRVALKLMHEDAPTPELRERFVRERDILARLHHACIAPLLDGGVSDHGTPYFTLELIDGEAITHWCDARRLDLAGRVRLLLKVCEAVQYAHRNLIVHRDLKPSNILVTPDGEPKLLDFGIAKLLDDEARGKAQLTGTQARPMTREYAAPEQVLAQPITTATDVYALGVLLYELLCGRQPYRHADSGVNSWPKAIVEEAPEPLSRALFRAEIDVAELALRRRNSPRSLQRALRGDLERIVRRALEKSPDSRYRAVADFADDLQAWLEHRPVSGGGWRYRSAKFARRHWLPLALLATVLFAGIAGGVGVVWQARATQREARTTAEVKEFLLDLFNAVDPLEAKGQDIRARDLVDRGAERIERSLGDQPALKGELQAVLGRIYYQLGAFAQSAALQAKAIDALQHDGSRPLLLVRTRTDYANTLSKLGEFDPAKAATATAAQELQALDDSPLDRLHLLFAQSRNEIEQHHFDPAAKFAQSALELARRAKVDPPELAAALLIAGNAEWGVHKLGAAEADYREGLSLVLPTGGDDDEQVLKLRSNLAMVLRGQSRFAESLSLSQKQLEGQRKLLGPNHPNTLRALRDVGLTQYHLGNYRLARTAIEECLAGERKVFGADNPEVAGTLINLGLALADGGDLGAAESAFAEARDILQKRYGNDHPGVITALGDLGYVHLLQHRLDEADIELQQSRGLGKKLGNVDGAMDLYRLGELQRLRGKPQDAIVLERQAVELSAKEQGEASRFTAQAHYYLGLALRDDGDSKSAIEQLRAALASYAGYIPGGDHPLAATVRLELAPLLAQQASTRDEALKLAAEAYAEREKFLGADDARTHAAQVALDSLRKSP
jgi:serine/threonine protein kinase